MNSGLTDAIAQQLAQQIVEQLTKEKTSIQTWTEIIKLIFNTIKDESVVKIDQTVIGPQNSALIVSPEGGVKGTFSTGSTIKGKIT